MQRPSFLIATLNAKYIHVNLAVRILYQLTKDKVNVGWKEFTIKEDRDNIAEYCSKFDCVAFSCYIWNITPTLEVCRKIKAINPSIKILLGGPEVSYDYEDVICREEVDYIISGEGENPFMEFVESFPNVNNVSSLIYKKGRGVIVNKIAPMYDVKSFEELDPYMDDNSEELKNKVAYIETSRGCPYKCEFCLASLDNKVRYLPDAHIKRTLLYLMQHGKVIKFLDRTFNMKRDFTLDIFQFILDHHRPENIFQFEITADILHPDIITFINEKVPKGLFRFEIGIQTVNQKANLEVSRKQNFEKTKNIIYQIQDKVELHLDLIVGMALDYWDDIKYSFEEVFKLHAPELQLGFLKFLKGTPVRDKSAIHGFIYDPNPPYQIIESNYLSKEQLEEIVILENALEIYWNKKRAIHTLKYITQKYSSFDFLLRLGKQFQLKSDFHKHNLVDVYLILYEFSELHYPEDKAILELITIDYYLHHKVKPKQLFIDNWTKKQQFEWIDKLNLNHHKYRFAIFPISFDYHHFVSTNEIVELNSIMTISFDGINTCKVLFEQNVLNNKI